MKPTINDVAKEAGVSRGTVDRVINKKGNVSPDAESKVIEAIKKLKYKRSAVASALARHKKSIKIGIIYPDVEHFFWKEVYKGIRYAKKEFDSFGVEIIVKTTKNYDYREQLNLLDYMENEKVSGIITMSYHFDKTDKKIEDLFKKKIPVVTFISDAPESKRLCYIGMNSYKSGVTAAKLMGLYLNGKGNVAIMGIHRDLSCMEDRINGFSDKIRKDYPNINIIGMHNTVEYRKDEEKLYRAAASNLTKEIIKNNLEIDGLYVTSMVGCVGNTFKSLGIKGTIKLIGHENTEEIKGLMLKDYITATVYQDQYEEIIRAINIIYKYIKEGKSDYSAMKFSRQGILIKENIE
jgi:LacI family transcriptional regulator